MNQPRVIFAGTPEFALASLRAIVEAGIRPIAVLTQPDRPAGRGRRLTPSPVKKYALAQELDVLQPATLRVVRGDDVPRYMGAKKVSMHQAGFQEVLASADLTGSLPAELALVGVQPELLDDYGGSLSWRPSPRTIVAAELERSLEETTLAGSSGYLYTALGGICYDQTALSDAKGTDWAALAIHSTQRRAT